MADPHLIVEEDTGAPPGHARLRIVGIEELADPGYRLRRLDAEPEHLGPQGWQNSPALLAPDAVEQAAGEVILKVGPAVVDRIGADAPIELELPALGLSLRSYWPDMALSPGAANPNVALASRTPAQPAPPVRPPAPPTPVAPPPPIEAGPEPVPPTPAPIEVAPAPKPEPPEPGPKPPEPAQKPRRWLAPAIGLLALLLIVGGAWQAGLFDRFFEPPSEPISEPTPEPTPQPPPEPTPEPAPAPVPTPPALEPVVPPAPVPPVEPTPPAHDWRAELLDYVRSTPEPAADRLLEFGQGAAEAGDQETALLAFEEAMKRGSGPAMRAIGRWYDPAYYSADSSPFSKANPEQAALYYKRAIEAGEGEAQTDLESLCASADAAEPWVGDNCPQPSGQ